MRKCGSCDFPVKLNRFLEWHSDGTVIGSVRPRIPLMFIEVAEWEAVFAGVSDRLGMPIDHILIEAQKNIGKELYEMVRNAYVNIDVKRIPVSRWLRPLWFGKLIVAGMRNDLCAFGAGRPALFAYRAGRTMGLRFENPSLITMVVGNCLGIYESVEKMAGARAEYGIEDGELVVVLRPVSERSEIEARLYLEEVQPGAGSLEFEVCDKCGVPLLLAQSLKWDIPRGMIVNARSGEREGMVAVQSLAAMIRELTRELGDGVPDILYDAQKTYTRQRLESVELQGDDFMDGMLLDMGLRGMGYPALFEYRDETATVLINSAYDQDLYAARIAAALERLTGKESSIEWRIKEPRHAEYVISTTA